MGSEMCIRDRYFTGHGVAKDETEAVRWYQLAADQGLSQAQFNLGYAYDVGQGVRQDHTQAFKWYRLAAAQGLVGAQFNLGLMYDTGKGVPQDDVQAYLWFTLAAERSNDEALERAIKHREAVDKRLTVEQRLESQFLAQEWNKALPRWAIADPKSVP